MLKYSYNQVRFQIEDIEISSRVGWALIEEVPFLLGCLDIFQKLVIELREFENKILLKQPNE